jgi:hypothetical protein
MYVRVQLCICITHCVAGYTCAYLVTHCHRITITAFAQDVFESSEYFRDTVHYYRSEYGKHYMSDFLMIVDIYAGFKQAQEEGKAEEFCRARALSFKYDICSGFIVVYCLLILQLSLYP